MIRGGGGGGERGGGGKEEEDMTVTFNTGLYDPD